MAAKLKPDVLQALQDWKAGKPVHSVELGHVHRMKETPGGASPQVDLSVRLSNDQERIHAFCFLLIEWAATDKVNSPFLVTRDAPHQVFLGMSAEFAKNWEEDKRGLTTEEREAAESLAWKALMIGWNRAIASHDPSRYIDVTNTEVVCAT